MILQNKTNQKIISFLLIISILTPFVLFSAPRKAHAVVCPPLTDNPVAVPILAPLVTGSTSLACATTVAGWVRRILEYALMAVIQAVLKEITDSIVGWINSGFHGSPLFLENPDSFFKDIVKSQIKTMVDQFGYDLRRFPFGKEWALSTINAYKSTAQRNAAHSLSPYMNRQQIANYMNFNVGGWNSFYLETLYPEKNTYVGSMIYLSNTLSATLAGAIEAPAEKINKLLSQGMGFLSPQKCDPAVNANYNNGYNEFNQPSFDEAAFNAAHLSPLDTGSSGCEVPKSDACQDAMKAYYEQLGPLRDAATTEWSAKNTCKKLDGTSGLINTTPGAVVADQIMGSLNAGKEQTILGSVLGTVTASIATIINTLINKFLSDGLNALSDTMTGEQTKDNWTFDGQSLDDDGGGNGGGGSLHIPQNVSIQLGSATNPTSTEITGGTAPYSIKVTNPITPDANVATAGLVGSTLTITGIAPGKTSVTIIDSSPNVKHVKVKITVVGDGSLMIVPADITINKGDMVTATVSGGTGDYKMTKKPNESIVFADFSSPMLIINALSVGRTSATITDSSGKTVKVIIIVAEPAALGTCTLNSGEIIEDISETACTAQGGTWNGGGTPGGPTVTLTANPPIVSAGGSPTLEWTSAGAVSCTATWTSKTDTTGSEIISPISATTTYDITCTGSDGTSTTGSVTVYYAGQNNS